MLQPRFVRLLALVSITLAIPATVSAQVVSGQALAGDWVRVDSNNDPNDLMRIVISATGGVLTSVPVGAANNWKVGDVLWRGIQGSGSLQVRGSDGNYYPSTMKMNGPDEIRLTVHYRSSTAGDDQTWRRAGPDITGDWVLVGPPGIPGDGTRINVQGVDASVRYIPATAPRVLRVGSRIWQSIGASGGLQVLGNDGQHHGSTWSLVAADRLHVNAPGIAGGAGQVWVRPTAVAAARANLQAPPTNPNAPGSGLTPLTPLPALPTTPSTPPVSPARPPACFATSRPHDAMGVQWGLSIYKAGRNPAVEEGMGLTPFLTGGLGGSGAGGNAPADLERILLPGLQDGYADLWERRPSRRTTWSRNTGMTAALLDQAIQAARTGNTRPTDIEGFLDTSNSTTFFSAVWENNLEGIDWKLEYDLTGQAYGTAFQNYSNNGYRLVDMEAYSTAAGLRYAAIWWASCDDANWKQVRDMDRAAYDARLAAESAQGFRVIDFESYGTSSGQRYAAIWQRIPAGRGWAVRTDRTFRWFLNYHREYSDLGMRLIDFESYDTPNGVRYAGVWAENEARYDFPFRAALEDSVEAYRQRHAIPGISVVAIRNDEVIYQGGFGWADSAAQKRAWSGTFYPTASIAKVIGATLAARFEQQGLMDLSQLTSDYLDYIDGSIHTHTVEQLLSKIGCMFHYPEGPEPASDEVYAYRKPAVEDMKDSPLLSGCTPGSAYRYSTHGFTFVGAVLEEVMGKTIYDIIQDELVVPFQLWDLVPMAWESFGEGPYAGQGIRPHELAQGYWWTPATGSDPRDYENMSWKVLGGGLQSSAMDLARFGNLTFNGTIVSTGTRDTVLLNAVTTGTTPNLAPPTPPATTAPAPPIVGLGWVLGMRNGGRNVAEHSGDTSGRWGGGSPTLRIYTDPGDSGLVIAVMNNQQNSSSVPVNSQPGAAMGGGQPVEGLATAIAATIFANPPP